MLRSITGTRTSLARNKYYAEYGAMTGRRSHNKHVRRIINFHTTCIISLASLCDE